MPQEEKGPVPGRPSLRNLAANGANPKLALPPRAPAGKGVWLIQMSSVRVPLISRRQQVDVCHAGMQMLPNVSQKKQNATPSLHPRKAHSCLSQFRYGAHAAMLALYDLSCVANLL